ncbi:MAG: hypothetical protein ACU0A4_04485 [Paracoccaceae bacterium]
MPRSSIFPSNRINPVFPNREARLAGRGSIRSWLHARRQDYTHFITLSTNDPMISRNAATQMLRTWDARVNHALLGSKWQKRPDERIVWFACLEGLNSACHWHLLARLSWDMPESKQEKWEAVDLKGTVDFHWKRISARGSTKTLLIHDSGAYDYVTKRLDHQDYVGEFIDSLTFKR